MAIYRWDNKHRNDTFRQCIEAINNAKKYDVHFNFIETDVKRLTLWIEIYDHGLKERNYAVYFWWEDMARIIGKYGQDIDFEKLTENQYLKLCKHIIKEIWGVVRMAYQNN